MRVQLLAAFASYFAAMSDEALVQRAHMLDPTALSEEVCAAIAATFAHCHERRHPDARTQAFLEEQFARWSVAAGMPAPTASGAGAA